MNILTILVQAVSETDVEQMTEFFNQQTILTLTGASGAVYVISSGVQKAFNYNPKWFALILAQIFAITAVFASEQVNVQGFAIGIVNGFLIYSTSVGANKLTTPAEGEGDEEGEGEVAEMPNGTTRGFLSQW